MIPESVAREINAYQPRRVEFSGKDSVGVGDVRTLTYGGVIRFVLVLEVDSISGTVRFQPTHSNVELATDFDLVVPARTSGLPFDLVIETELESVARTMFLGNCLTVLTSEVVNACQGVEITSKPKECYFGYPMTGPLDARWEFKVFEGEFVRSASYETLLELLDFGSQWTFDLENILSSLQEPVDDAPDVAVKVFEAWSANSDSFILALDVVDELWSKGLLDVASWDEHLGDIGVLFFESVLLPMIELSRSKLPEFTLGVRTVTIDLLREFELV